jgi:hypothetical protein
LIRSVSLSGEVRHPKLPLLMLTFATGISSAINQAVFKFFGEILQSGDAVLFSPFEMVLLMWGVLQSLLTLLLLNVAVYLYEQIDVAPFYQAFLTIFKILTGLVVLGEASYYDWKGLMTVAACASLIVAGIAVNIIKTQSESHVLYPLLT